MNLERIIYDNGTVMLRSRNTAPVTMNTAELFLTFAMWLVRVLSNHACIERLDFALSELHVVGVSRAGDREKWESVITRVDIANEQIAAAVFSMYRLTHLKMRGFEFVYHSESYAPCLWQNLSVLDYYSFVGTVTIPLVRVRDCVRFVDCRCVWIARLRNAPVCTLVLDKILLSDKLCSDLHSCPKLRFLAIGSWIGNRYLPAPLASKSIALWVSVCKRLKELRILNMNQLSDVAFVNSNVSVLNCRAQLSVNNGDWGPGGPGRVGCGGSVGGDENALFEWVRRTMGATSPNCHVRIYCKNNFTGLRDPPFSAGVPAEFTADLERMLESGAFPYAYATKVTLRPSSGGGSGGAQLIRVLLKTTGKEERSVSLDLDFESRRNKIHVTYDGLLYNASRLEEICMQLPVSLCTATNMSPHFEIIATHPSVTSLVIDSPVLCGWALRELLTCLTFADNQLTNVSCNMYISSDDFVRCLALMLQSNVTLKSVKGVIFRKSIFAVTVSNALISRQPQLKEFHYTVKNRGIWSDEYEALSTLNKIINHPVLSSSSPSSNDDSISSSSRSSSSSSC